MLGGVAGHDSPKGGQDRKRWTCYRRSRGEMNGRGGKSLLAGPGSTDGRCCPVEPMRRSAVELVIARSD
ncbi:hypothetical protein EMIT048CA2_60123 [Pseudomonas chlororaphis]